MTTDIKYKLQGNGKHSWEVRKYDDNGDLIDAYLVFEDPTKEKKIDISKIDVDTMTQADLQKLANKIKPLL